MVDNVTLPGTGKPVRTKEFAGKHVQLILGADAEDAEPFELASQETLLNVAEAHAPAQPITGSFENIPDLSSAIGLTVPEDATRAIIQAETADVRWRDDGTDPDETTGILLEAGAALVYRGNLGALKFIGIEPYATLNVSYYL